MTKGFREVEIGELDSIDKKKLENVTDRLLNLKQYFDGNSATFNDFLLMLRQLSGTEGTLIHYLHEKLE